MIRLLRIPVVLIFAGLCTAGSYVIGFRVLDDSWDTAGWLAFVGGIFVGLSLGGLTSRIKLVLLGMGIAIVAMWSAVDAAGLQALHEKPRAQVTVTADKCVQKTIRRGDWDCGWHQYTLTDSAGRPVTSKLDQSMQVARYDVGQVLDVYEISPGTIKIYPVAQADGEAVARGVAIVSVPLFIGYVLVLGIAGAVSRTVSRRRAVQPGMDDGASSPVA